MLSHVHHTQIVEARFWYSEHYDKQTELIITK